MGQALFEPASRSQGHRQHGEHTISALLLPGNGNRKQGARNITSTPTPVLTSAARVGRLDKHEPAAAARRRGSRYSDEDILVQFRTRDGTAVGGAQGEADIDYVHRSGVLAFKPGESVKVIEIEVRRDSPRSGSRSPPHGVNRCRLLPRGASWSHFATVDQRKRRSPRGCDNVRVTWRGSPTVQVLEDTIIEEDENFFVDIAPVAKGPPVELPSSLMTVVRITDRCASA